MTADYTNMPQATYLIGKSDSGEFGAVRCPHCDAKGRYVYSFKCADGSERGAMQGCFNRWPKHPFVAEQVRIMDKQADYAKKGWKLAEWDSKPLEAIKQFAAGEITEQAARSIVDSYASQRRVHVSRKFAGRR